MAENVYLNVQVLKGIPVDQFNDTMGMFASALLLDCVGCHDPKITFDPKAFALPTPRIQRARQMVVMMNTLNKMYFGGQQRVTCFTCHNGDPSPERSPSLRLQYGELVNDPSSFKFFLMSRRRRPRRCWRAISTRSAEPQRLAGAHQLCRERDLHGVRNQRPGSADGVVRPRRPDQRAMVVETGAMDLMMIHNGRNAWRYQPDTPIPLIELTGWSLTGSRVDTMAFFPTTLPKAFAQWQVGIRRHRRQAGRGRSRHEPRAVAG